MYAAVPSHRFNYLISLSSVFLSFSFSKTFIPSVSPPRPPAQRREIPKKPFFVCLESRERFERGADDTHTALTDVE